MYQIVEQGRVFKWFTNGGAVMNDQAEIIGRMDEDDPRLDTEAAVIGRLRAIAIAHIATRHHGE
jgi:hypothetical protein